MTTDSHSTVAAVEPDVWDGVCGESHIVASHGFLTVLEKARINDCIPFYVTVTDAAGLAATAAAYSISTDTATFAPAWFRCVVGWVRRVFPSCLMMRTLECGNPVALGTTLSFRQGILIETLLEPLINGVEAEAGCRGTRIVLWRDFLEGELEITRVLERRGYRRVANLPATELTIRWDTFEAYLASMKSRYRNKILAQMRMFEDAGVQTELIHSFGHLAADLEGLWRQSYDHASEYRREVLTADFFKAMDEELGSRSAVLLFRVEGKPAAFSLLLFDDDTLIPLYCGLDYALNERCSLYFNLLYGAIRVALEMRLSRIDFGITTLFPKVHLGCSIVRQAMYVRHNHRLMTLALATVFRLATPPCTVIEPQVFKQ